MIRTSLPPRFVLTAMDSEHWITVHPHGDGPGQPVLIEGSASTGYTIVGGAGGSLNGTKVSPGSMSGAREGTKTEDKPAAPPTRREKAAEVSSRANAHQPSSTASLGELREAEKAHREAAQEHADAWKEASKKPGEDDDAIYHADANRDHRNNAMRIKMRADKLEKTERMAPIKADSRIKAMNDRYATTSHADIAAEWGEKYGLGLRAEGETHRVRGHKDYNIDDKTAQAKSARKTLGRMAATLDGLEARGIDVKATLSQGKVAFAPGNVGAAWGHAYQLADGRGILTLSSSKTTPAFLAEQQQIAQKATDAGKRPWTVASTHPPEEMEQMLTIHELAHALGMQRHINSPMKLRDKLVKMFPDPTERHVWIRENISRYATQDMQETDAELAALVLSPSYKSGTVPKELEDHVYDLFKRKA
jgi:hypothetical protein